MDFGKDVGKLLVRNIPRAIFDALGMLAERRDRSTEAEARQAIKAWVAPELVDDDRRTRLKLVAHRLNELLEQVNADRAVNKVDYGHVALAIGEERAQHVEDWFLGLQEPTFRQLASVATHYGVNEVWLQLGTGSIYPVREVRIPEAAPEAVDWFMSWTDGELPEGDFLNRICLVRERNEGGHFSVVKISKGGRYKIYSTPYKVSEDIGAGGEGSLMRLFVAWELLYIRYTTAHAGLTIGSYLMAPEDVRALHKGNTNPAKLLAQAHESTWWEDVWDRQQYPTREYWPGWKSLCQRIDRAIDQSSSLAETRRKIRSSELK